MNKEELMKKLKEVEKEYKEVAGKYFKLLCEFSDLVEAEKKSETLKNYKDDRK